MAMKRSRIDKSLRRLRRRRDDPEKTRAYTPGEIHRLAHETTNSVGIMRPDTGRLEPPLRHRQHRRRSTDGPPVAGSLIIVVIAMFWIGLITYFVSQMPDPPEREKARQNVSVGGRNTTEADR